jgi:membrane protease YdiL (CAAX protease family)
VLVVALVWREQRSLRWSTLREVLWLRSPRSPRSGRIGGRVWLILIPLVVVFAAANLLLPAFEGPESHDLGAFLESGAGQTFLSGNWFWFAVVAVPMIFTVFGEELLFRGFLLPRMHGAFGRGDWIANGILFAAFHIDMPWNIPSALADMFILAYPTKRYRSAWIGMAVHGTQSLFFTLIVLAVVI